MLLLGEARVTRLGNLSAAFLSRGSWSAFAKGYFVESQETRYEIARGWVAPGKDGEYFTATAVVRLCRLCGDHHENTPRLQHTKTFRTSNAHSRKTCNIICTRVSTRPRTLSTLQTVSLSGSRSPNGLSRIPILYLPIVPLCHIAGCS